MTAELRSVLEGIVFGDDVRITPTDRLKAAEQLHALGDDQPDRAAFFGHLDELPADDLDRQLDGDLVVDVVRAILAGKPVAGIDPANFPVTSRLLEVEIERRVGQRLAHDPVEREREVRERAEQLAEQMYRLRSFRAVGDAPSGPGRPIIPPDGVDPRRGWSDPGSGRIATTLEGRRRELRGR